MKSDYDFEHLEKALLRAGKELRYPPTPRLAARVRVELERPSRSLFAPGSFGLWAGFAGAAVALLLVLAGVFIYQAQQTSSPQRTAGKAYIANLLSGDLTVVDLQTRTRQGSVAVGGSPWGLAASKDGQRVFVAVDGGVAVVDPARAQRVDFIETPGFTRAKVAISGDGRTLLVANPSGRMKLIDIPSRGTLNEFPIEMLPYDIKLAPNNRWAYVLSQDDGAVAVVNVREGQMVNRLPLGEKYRGYFMALSADGEQVYVPKLGTGAMWIIDTQTNAARSVRTERKAYWEGNVERGVAVSADGARLYIATAGDNTGGVSVLETQNFSEVARANLASGFFGAALSLDGKQLLLTDPETNNLTILNADTLKLIGTVQLGSSPFRVVVAP